MPRADLYAHRFVRECRKNGKHIAVWTVNSPFEWLECTRLGVDAIITDRNAAYRTWQRSIEGAFALAHIVGATT